MSERLVGVLDLRPGCRFHWEGATWTIAKIRPGGVFEIYNEDGVVRLETPNAKWMVHFVPEAPYVLSHEGMVYFVNSVGQRKSADMTLEEAYRRMRTYTNRTLAGLDIVDVASGRCMSWAL